MTGEEAIEYVNRQLDVAVDDADFMEDEMYEALQTLVNIAEQEPCEDTISRQAVLDLVVTNHTELNGVNVVMYSPFCKDIKQLPPVTPKAKSDVLDKIRAEIIELRSKQNVGVTECLDILDKYRK